MHYLKFARVDTTIYSDHPTQNCGRDEILEIIKTFSSASYSSAIVSTINSRALVQFDLTDISQSIVDGTIANPRFYLNMYICTAKNQEQTTNLYIYPISSSWVQGVGKRFDYPIRTAGASWTASDGDVPTYWDATGSDYILADIVTTSLWSNENTFQSSGHYTYELADLRADVTSIVNNWFNESYVNNGFLIKRSDSEETNTKDYGYLQFYSIDTNTIYNPKLEVAWDDSSFITGSLTSSNMTDMYIYAKNMDSEYNNGEKVQIRLGVRKKYPRRSYSINNAYEMLQYLPSSSYYSIVDAQSLHTLIPFDTGSTKISCDSSGSFFNIWMNSFHPSRYYNIRIEVVSGSLKNIYELPVSFKVVR